MDLKEKIKNLTPEQLKKLLQKQQKSGFATPKREARTNQFFPLSFSQKRIWFQSEFEKNKSVYNNPVAFQISNIESFDIRHLNAVLQSMIQRHEILRTTFSSRDGILMQVVRESLPVNIAYEDLRQYPMENRMQKAKDLACQDALKEFDLNQGPLIRFSIFQVGDDDYIFLLVTHHLISDGWSNNLFFLEFAKLAFALSSENPPLMQYLDYVFWESKRFDNPNYEELLSFWKELLSGDLPVTKFPQEYVDVAEKNLNSCQKVFPIPRWLWQKIKEFSQKNHITTFITLLSAFKVLLCLYNEEDDLVIGIPYANRSNLDFQKTLGLFINIIPFRSQINLNDSFLHYIQQIDELIKKAFVHADIPFNFLVEHLPWDRNSGLNPFFQILFVYQNFPHAYESPGVKISPLPLEAEQTEYNLTFIVDEFQKDLLVKIKFKEAVFDPFYIDKIMEHFTNVLETIVAYSEEPISKISILSSQERQWLQERANHKDHDKKVFAYEETFCSAFEQQANRTPKAIAIEFQDVSLTYEELNKEANKLAHHILSFNITAETPIAILLERSPSFIVALLAVLKSGAAFVPMDSSFPKSRLEFQLKESKAALLITDTSGAFRMKLTTFPVIVLDREVPAIQNLSSENLPRSISKHNLAYIMFTSGLTNPEGVCVEHEHLSAYLQSIQYEIGPFQPIQFAFTGTIVADTGYTNIFLPLMLGASCHIIPHNITEDPERFSDFLMQHPVDCLTLTPSQLGLLLHAKNSQGSLPRKLLILAGEATPYELIEKIKQLNPNLKVIISYGSTETTLGALLNTHVEEKSWNNYPVLGHANLYSEVYILDRRMQMVPIGVAGEIYIGGKTVSRGYVNHSSWTEKHFYPNPFSKIPGEKIYKTGDKARFLKDGQIEFLGRKDRQVKIKGERIELTEIETALRNISAIAEAVVHKFDTGGLPKLVAFVVLKNEKSLDENEIKKILNNWLPSNMIPSEIFFLEKLHLTPSGKIDYNIFDQYLAASKQKKVVLPRDSVELMLVKIWEELLQTKNINIQDSFFDLGGHSFLALKLVLKIEEAFHVNVPLSIFFENNTIEALAKKIRENSVEFYQNPLVTIKKGKNSGNFFLVHPAGGQVLCYADLSKNLKKDFSIYGLQSPFLQTEELVHHDTIEKIASQYISAISKNLLEDQEILLGGWSLGGVIAYEMGAQIFNNTKKSPRIVIIDQPAFGIEKNENAMETGLEYLMRFMKQVESFNDIKFEIDWDAIEELPFLEQSSVMYQKFVEKKLLPEDVTKKDFYQFLQLQKIHSAAARKYEPGKYFGPVLLLRGQTSRWDNSYPPGLGWQSVCSDLTIKWIEATHASIIKEPQIKTVAFEIESWIDSKRDQKKS